MKRITARFYRTASGTEPAREWLLELSKDDRKAVGTDIATVEFGWPIGLPVCRAMGKGLYEVRTNLTGNRIARVLFTITGDTMVLLHGFIKKSRKTPKTDLDLAQARKADVT
jgi:phage-related protein